METFIYIVIALAIYIFYKLVIDTGPAHPPPPDKPKETTQIFQKKKYFFGLSERIFFDKLSRAIEENQYIIFSQVRLADLVKCEKKQIYIKTLPYHVDFVICRRPEYKICLAIELDSPYHSSAKQIKRDLFKTQVLEDAKIPLLRFRVEEKNLTPAEIKNRLAPHLDTKLNNNQTGKEADTKTCGQNRP